MAKTAFLGLGVMGFPMAGHLAAAGHQVTVFNRSPAKPRPGSARHGGASAATPREAAQGADLVMCCVGNDDDLRQVCLGPDGAFAGMAQGAVFVDHTTVSAKVTESWRRRRQRRASAMSMHPYPAVRRGPKTASCRSCAGARSRISIAPRRSSMPMPRSVAGWAMWARDR